MDEPLTFGAEPDEVNGNYLASFPFFPNQFYSELPLPRSMEALSLLACTVLTNDGGLNRGQKEMLVRGVGTLLRNDVCAVCFRQAAPAKSPQDRQLLKFSLKLAKLGPWISIHDIESLRQAGFDDGAILETAITTAIGKMFCTLADGLVPPPEFTSHLADATEFTNNSGPVVSSGPYLNAGPLLPDNFPPYQFFREQFGFLPTVFRAQALRPGLLEIEAKVLDAVLFSESSLNRRQKEKIMMVVSAKNLNTYFVAVLSESSKKSGVSTEDSDQIVRDYKKVTLSTVDKGLLDFACSLSNSEQGKLSTHGLRQKGCTGPQIVEAIAICALTNFLNTLQFALGSVPF